MLKIIVTNLIRAVIATFTPDDRADMVASTARATKRISHTDDPAMDYAEILRAACQDGRRQVFISRSHALGAAAEIEQLWAALSITMDYTSNSAPPTSKASLTQKHRLLD